MTPKPQPSGEPRSSGPSDGKKRRLSANRMLVELIENGIAADKQKEQAFFKLAERCRSARDPEEVKQLGDELGRMVFGD